MDSDNQNFCTRCGRSLAEDARYCPECGARVPGRNPEQVEEERQMVRTAVIRQLKWAAVAMAIYSIPFLIIGIYTAVSIDSMTDLVVNDPNFSSYAEAYGLTYDEVHSYFQYASILYIVSSLCGLVSVACCWRRTHYWVALAACILSIFIGASGLLALFLGFIALWLVMTSKLGFKEYEDRLDEALSEIQ